jgi:hypothetical protein
LNPVLAMLVEFETLGAATAVVAIAAGAEFMD